MAGRSPKSQGEIELFAQLHVTAFLWWDFFTLAEELSKSPANEAGTRTAIRRYYYACHNGAKPRVRLQHTEL